MIHFVDMKEIYVGLKIKCEIFSHGCGVISI